MLCSLARTLVACASFLLVTWVTLLPQSAGAQAAVVEVAGTVTADDATPIAGATVTLNSQSGTETARTDASGRFSIPNVTGGTYSVFVSAPGFQRISQRTVTIGPGASTLTLVLSQATTNSLIVIGNVRAAAGETVSTASAPSVTLSAQDAAASGTAAVSSMIWTQLGTTPVLPLGGGSNATVSFAVRGPDPTETLVDLDGHQVNNGNTGDFDLSLVDPAALQSVQLIYGISPASLLGPNQIGGAINILTLQPTTTPHALLRAFGGSYGSFGETAQATGTDDRFGYAFSIHGMQSLGSVNQTIFAPPPGTGPSSKNLSPQSVGSNSNGDSLLGKLRYQLGGENGYGYIQLDFRGQSVTKDESSLLTNYTPPNFTGGESDDALLANLTPDDKAPPHGFQSFTGTTLGATQSNYGVDLQLPLGNQTIAGAPATLLQFSHLTSVNSQSVDGPGADTLPYLYDQRDLLIDDWLQIDHHFASGDLSFKYDLGTESLTTDYVQGQVTAEWLHAPQPFAITPFAGDASPPTQIESIAQTQRSAVLRYSGDPSSEIHYSVEGYLSNFSTFGTSFDPRAGFVWTPTGNTAVRASVGTTFQVPQLSELVVPPLADRVAVGGIVFIGNPNLQPDRATDYDLGMEQIFGKLGHQLHLSMDLYQSNLRSPANQLNVNSIGRCNPHIGTPLPPGADARALPPCPISYPVNAGNGIYRGIDVSAEQQLGQHFRVRAGWDVDSSYLTVVPQDIQDGTLVLGEQSLGQPLHKAYLDIERDAERGLVYGTELNYEGTYNELNRTPYATLNAHVAYRNNGFEYGLYGTNLTNVYSNPFTVQGGGIVYGAQPGQPVIYTPAYVLQGSKVVFVVTRSI